MRLKRTLLIIPLIIVAAAVFARPAAAAICQSVVAGTACQAQASDYAPFVEPEPRPGSLTAGVTYGWIEDYARFYETPEPGARHVRTAMTGFFYGPAKDVHVDEEGNTWYFVWDYWLPARYYHHVEADSFAGVEVNRQPERPFGWILRPIQALETPTGDPVAGDELQRYDFVTVYGYGRGSDGSLWYDIGDRGWVRHDYVALNTVRQRPAGVGADEFWVDVDLNEQTIAAYEGDRMVFAALISSGLPQWATRVGLNQVWDRRLSAPMRGGVVGEDYYYLSDVLHTLYFDGEISLHNAYWHDDFGRPKSHGCVNLAPRVAEWIYYWSMEGPNDLWVWTHHGREGEFVQ